jgi:hypothetical protein
MMSNIIVLRYVKQMNHISMRIAAGGRKLERRK